jgi:type VI secretion system protein ImpK
MATITQSLRGGLADLCADLLAFALELKRSGDPGDAETLRLKIDEQFRDLDVRARQADIPQESVQLAKYAIAAFIDETILTSSWAIKDAWADKPLQLAYFNDFSAGEEFYTKIDAARGAKNAAVLEVYYLCLALGFRGKYVDLQGMEKKKILMDTMLREIKAALPPEVQGLSPRWQPPDALPALARNFPAWLVAAAGGLFLLGLYLLLSFLLGFRADAVLKVLG